MRCVAVGCKTGRKSGIRIHSFPRDAKRRLEWAVKVNIAENGKLWVPPKDSSYGICEAHFDEDQYEPRRTDRKLKPFAVPTLFSHRKAPKRRRKLVRDGPQAVAAGDRPEGPTTPTMAGSDTPATTSQQQQGTSRHPGGPAGASPSAFTVSTSGGNVILVPTPPAASQARSLLATPAPIATGTQRTPLGPLTPVQSQNIVLPPVNCLPNTAPPPIFLVPVSRPDPRALVPSTPMPVILSVESLSVPSKATPQSGVAGATPLLAKPQSYEQLQQEADSLRQQADDLRREQAEMQRQCVRIKTALARQSERLGRFLRLDQVESLQREEGSSSVRWSEPTLRFALGLYCCSAEAYGRLLAAHWPLPPERDLRTFCRERGVREGVPPQLLQGPSGEQQGNIVWL